MAKAKTSSATKKKAPKKTTKAKEPTKEETKVEEPKAEEVTPEDTKPEEPEEKPTLRVTELESVELTLCERDHEYAKLQHELSQNKLVQLTMEYSNNKSVLLAEIRSALEKVEQTRVIWNRKLGEVEKRLQAIDPDFLFKDYLEQGDGTLVREEDIIAAKDPTAGQEGPPA